MMQTVRLRSTLTCPGCGREKRETMPTDRCVYFYVCDGCGLKFKPLSGDCCGFCSFGTVKCPPIQTGSGCC